MTEQPLDALPLWAIYTLIVLSFLTAVEGGYRLSKRLQQKSPAKAETGIGAITASVLALLSFLLALIVNHGVDLFDKKHQLVIDEANAIGTAYLRAGYLGEPYRTEARNLLREYLDLRLAALDPAKIVTAISRTEQIHGQLWKSAEAIARESPTSMTSLYVSGLNEVRELRNERINVSLRMRLPPTVLLGVYIVALFALFLVGMQSGYVEKRSRIALLILVLILSVVFILIVDLDHAQEGFLQVSQQALIDLQRLLHSQP